MRNFIKIGLIGLASLMAGSSCKIEHLLGFYKTGPIESVQILGQDTLSVFKSNWTKMEQCTGRTGIFDDWTYWQYPDSVPVFCSDRERGCWGGTDFHRNKIYLYSPHVLDEKVFGHEQVRALMGKGVPDSTDFIGCGVYPRRDGMTENNYFTIER